MGTVGPGRKFIPQREWCGPHKGEGTLPSTEGLGGMGCRGEAQDRAHQLCNQANEVWKTGVPQPVASALPQDLSSWPGCFLFEL